MRRLRRLCLCAIVLLAVCGLTRAAVAAEWVAPSVELRGPKGTPIRLVDLRGRVVLMKFWASWCPQCAEMFGALDALDRDYRPRGVDVIAVNVDEHRRDADRFLKQRTYKVRVAFDPRARAFDAFGGSGVPVAYLIDRRGVIRYVHEGDVDAPDATYREQLDALLAEIR